ncbi:MAG: glutamate-1-semialdehyde 2,1-aminomutase [Cryomorphaceae bacterium]|nr:glutamate-1-semialdehyde 2,1-aminomutase [Cryomorphaceae bacterium]
MDLSRSIELFSRAQKSIPGGVNSPVRAFKSVGGSPIFFKSAKGAYLTDEDGNQYIDYINSWGPMILGHGKEEVIDAVKSQAEKAFSFGAPTELEIEVAEQIKTMVPWLDVVRMVNSGTEACMSAVRLARGYTGKNKIIKFAGCYHGHADGFLIQAGSGALTLGEPNSPGVTEGTAKDTLLARFNDFASVVELVSNNPEEIAAIIVEPVAGNMGCIPPNPDFLVGLRSLCDRENIVLIFDEVMTGFRLSPAGAAGRLGVEPDLATYGKVIGGGMPVGAFGGKRHIFEHLAPNGPVYQAGTLSGNPLAMVSGKATLKYLNDHPEVYQKIDNTTANLHREMEILLLEKGVPFQINRIGSMISLHFCEGEVVDFESATVGNNEHFKLFFHHMLNSGVYLPPSAYETWFISDAIGNPEREKTIDAFSGFLKSL